MSDLSHLNDGECRVLALLAEGHTVKSIANMTGWTVAAVNERLRSARRKAGVGSSRELARFFAQQHETKKIGLEASSKNALNIARESRDQAGSKWKGVTAMTLLLVAAVSAALALQQLQSAAASDPMIDGLLDERDPQSVLDQIKPEQNPENVLASEGMNSMLRRLHSHVRTEKRDDNWSPRTESLLRRFFLRVPSVGSPQARLRVLCSATLCEVTANLPNRPTAAGQLYLPEFQNPSQDAAVQKLGLKPLPKVLGSTSAGPLYLSYWRRDVARGYHR